jgi:hypothetical protein
MDSLKQIWQKWNVPIDILNLVKVYLSPYRCPICCSKNFLGANERYCSKCTAPIFELFEKIFELFDRCEKIPDIKINNDLYEEEYKKFVIECQRITFEIDEQHKESSKWLTEMKTIHWRSFAYLYRYSTDKNRDKDLFLYFKNIGCKEFKYHTRRVQMINKIRDIFNDINSNIHHFVLFGYRNGYIERYENFKKAAFVY